MLHHVAVSTHIWHNVNHPPCVGVSWCTYTSMCACDLLRTTYCVAAAAPSNESPCSLLIGFRVPPCLKPCLATVSDCGFPLPCTIVIGLDAHAPQKILAWPHDVFSGAPCMPFRISLCTDDNWAVVDLFCKTVVSPSAFWERAHAVIIPCVRHW